MAKVCVYIDGGNLYNRLKEAGRKAYPLPGALHQFAQELCTVTPDDAGTPLAGQLVDVLYCNAPVKVPAGQANPLQAFTNRLRVAAGFRVRDGSRKDSPHRCPHASCGQEILSCPHCGNALRRRTVEKGVDLQIAAECVADGAMNVYDIALVFTHDEDYSQLAQVLRDRCGKEMRVAYLVTPRSVRPSRLIRSTPSGQGLAADNAPCFDAVFPPWAPSGPATAPPPPGPSSTPPGGPGRP